MTAANVQKRQKSPLPFLAHFTPQGLIHLTSGFKGNVSLFGTDILFVTRHLLKNDEIYGSPTFSTSEISITFAWRSAYRGHLDQDMSSPRDAFDAQSLIPSLYALLLWIHCRNIHFQLFIAKLINYLCKSNQWCCWRKKASARKNKESLDYQQVNL